MRDQRVEFVVRASRGESLSSLCREYEISRPTGYVWLKRFGEHGIAGIEEYSRRPHVSPQRTAAAIEARIVMLRLQRPDWGARKLTQGWLDNFRHEYNQLHPHEALGMRTPASLWRPSTRVYDSNPQAWDYGPGAELRKVGLVERVFRD